MKRKITILTLALMAIVTVQSQNFLSADKQWNVKFNHGGGPSGYTTEIFTIDGDSLIGNINYLKLYKSSDSLESNTLACLVREVENKVYYWAFYMDEEALMYDFNLQLGEQTNIVNSFGTANVEVINVDTVEYEGIERKRLEIRALGAEFPTDYWIEGIGSTCGPIYSVFWANVVCSEWKLLCCHKSSNLLYMYSTTEGCYQSSLGISDIDKETVCTLNQNPIPKGEPIAIKTQKPLASIFIYNIEGNLIKQLNTQATNSINIDTYNLPSGLYLLTLNTTDQHTFHQKVLIE